MKIEKGIPLPPAKGGKKTELSETLAQMEPGDSILLEVEKKAMQLKQTGSRRGYKMAFRKIDGQGWRVWRLA